MQRCVHLSPLAPFLISLLSLVSFLPIISLAANKVVFVFQVGGLPLAELNHLELQFLLLNDFRLAVPVEDLEAYATMLVEFYAREVVAQRSRPVAGTD